MEDDDLERDEEAIGEPMIWAVSCWAFCFVLGAGMVLYQLLERILK